MRGWRMMVGFPTRLSHTCCACRLRDAVVSSHGVIFTLPSSPVKETEIVAAIFVACLCILHSPSSSLPLPLSVCFFRRNALLLVSSLLFLSHLLMAPSSLCPHSLLRKLRSLPLLWLLACAFFMTPLSLDLLHLLAIVLLSSIPLLHLPMRLLHQCHLLVLRVQEAEGAIEAPPVLSSLPVRPLLRKLSLSF